MYGNLYDQYYRTVRPLPSGGQKRRGRPKRDFLRSVSLCGYLQFPYKSTGADILTAFVYPRFLGATMRVEISVFYIRALGKHRAIVNICTLGNIGRTCGTSLHRNHFRTMPLSFS